MKELDFLKIIAETLDDSSFIGNDCAYLEEFGLFVTQDTLVEDVHFSTYTTNAYLLGRKSVSVNLSDLAAAFAKPLYITVSLSMPKMIKNSFVENFYRGVNDVCREYGVKVIGGDITSSEKITISVCAIGKKVSDFLTGRNKAKNGNYIVVTGNFGASGAGLYALQNFLYVEDVIKNAHLNPTPRVNESLETANILTSDIAVMDTSDGLADALYKISLSSKHSIEVDFDKIPVKQEVVDFAKRNNLSIDDLVLWGGEDYELVMCVDEETYSKLNFDNFKCIGKVLNKDNFPTVTVKHKRGSEKISSKNFEEKSFNHFGVKLDD